MGATPGEGAPARTNPYPTAYVYSDAVAADTYPSANGYAGIASQRSIANRHTHSQPDAN
ncbi:MAG: hypothetical protein Kow0063_29850 [Anaerolineae bacterium]